MKTLIQTIFVLSFVGITIQGCSKNKGKKFEDLTNENNLTLLIQKCDNYEKDIIKRLSSGDKEAHKDMEVLRDICGNSIGKIRRRDFVETTDTDDVPMP